LEHQVTNPQEHALIGGHERRKSIRSSSSSTGRVWGDAWSTRWNPSLWATQGWFVAAPNEPDFRVPVDQGLQMFTALRRNGVPSEALVFPDEGHWVLKAANSRVWHEAVFRLPTSARVPTTSARIVS
jgi:hypothetical protein